MTTETITELKCYHCGQACDDDLLWMEEKPFCCYGCKTVYEILNTNNLCEYYDFSETPGVRSQGQRDDNYLWLDESDIRKKLLTFDSDTYAKIHLYIPAIHCVSCVW